MTGLGSVETRKSAKLKWWCLEAFLVPTNRTLTLFMAKMPPQSSMYCFKSRSRYSKTKVSDFSVWTMSCNVTEIESNYWTAAADLALRTLTNVVVLKVFEQRDFSDGGAGGAFLVLQSYLFESHQIVGQPWFAFENGGVCALTNKCNY